MQQAQFMAGPSMLGYLYQVRYALLLLLRADPDAQISLELLDDVAFESDGTPVELIQTKHHVDHTGSLGDASPDLWKTLRVWSTAAGNGTLVLPTTRLSMISTAYAPDRSAAALLRPTADRAVDRALSILVKVATSSRNKGNKPSYEAFMALSDEQRLSVLNAMFVLDGAVGIVDILADIKLCLRFSARRDRIDSLCDRLEGWWLRRVIDHLSAASGGPISSRELEEEIYDISEQLKPDALPVDYLMVEQSDVERGASRRFVEQLRLVEVGAVRIEQAIRDYYRSYSQRSKWVRENLVSINEVSRYEGVLIDEWVRYRERAVEELPPSPSGQELKSCGRRIYDKIDTALSLPIRPTVQAPYIMRGSYHILADEATPRVWWHPEYPRLKVDATPAAVNG